MLLRNGYKHTPLTMSVSLQFKCLIHNETAKKAIESYSEILQKAFQHYQNLWEDYIKLQEKCNAHSLSQVTIDTSCTKIKDEAIFQHFTNPNVQGSNSFRLVESDTLNTNYINFNCNTRTNPSDASESSYKDADENNPVSPPRSPVFSRTFLKTGSNAAKKLMRSSKAVGNSTPTSDMKPHHSSEKVPPKDNHKLEISTTHHVETTFLPSGKRMKQSRLIFHPIRNNEKIVVSSDVDKYKSTSMIHNVQQNFIQDISTADVVVIENNSVNNTSEISDDVIEISPTQKNIASKAKRCLKFKKKIPTKHMIKISPSKDKYPSQNLGPSAVSKITDIKLCPFTKHNSMQMKDDKSFIDTAVGTLQHKVETSYFSPIKMHNESNIQVKKSIEVQKKDQLLINELQNLRNDFASEDETFYLPAEQAASRNNMANLNLNDTENKPPKKKMLLDKLNVLPKRRVDVEKLNMRCKTDREKLNGWDCWECREYYKNLSLSKEELQKRRNQCSRHRHQYERPKTPEGFWDPEFPETLSSTYRQDTR